jgi:methanol--5-hydroxybenzimidazolylcobamide Co-methyltransferase
MDSTQKTYEQLPDDSDKFLKASVKRYGRQVKDHDIKQYDL